MEMDMDDKFLLYQILDCSDNMFSDLGINFIMDILFNAKDII
jgi:hypothetical membrane protein